MYNTGKIYKIVNNINNKIYIGKTIKSLNERFSEHICTAKRWLAEDVANKKHQYLSRLYPAMNKYGYENFSIELVEEISNSKVDLETREKYWIAYFNTTNDTIGYNISPGGYGGPLFKGHAQSEKCKQINSLKSKGIHQSTEFVKKRSYARARLMQNLTDGNIYSILDLPKGYFYKQAITAYRIYKSANIFYVCLESPHNRKPALPVEDCKKLLAELYKLEKDNKDSLLLALHAGLTAMRNDSVAKEHFIELCKKAWKEKQKRYWDAIILQYNINIEEYKATYYKFKDNCPNRHLELIYGIPYNQIRKLNKFLGLFGGGSGHKNGKIVIEESS